MKKIIDCGGVWSLWRGNGTYVMHQFPYSAINFFVYEHTLDFLEQRRRGRQHEHDNRRRIMVITLTIVTKRLRPQSNWLTVLPNVSGSRRIHRILTRSTSWHGTSS
jgi:hypothetical protein